MKVIETGTQAAKAWRVLMILTPGEPLGICWQFGSVLARANNGQLLAAVIIPDASEPNLAHARTAVDQIKSAASSSKNGKNVNALIVEDGQDGRGVEKLVQQTGADMLLVRADGPIWHDRLNYVSCAVAVVRGDQDTDLGEIVVNGDVSRWQRILVPTSSGPNTAHALRLLLPLATKSEITALYVANAAHGPNREALGWSRLRDALHFAGASERIHSKVISCDSVIEGIVTEAADHDLVLLGASQKSHLDRALFGDIPGAVTRFSRTPVIIVRQPKDRLSYLGGQSGLAHT